MKFKILLIIFQLILLNIAKAQTNKGIHFQAIARNENGIIIPNKQITLRISILTDSSFGNIIYQEIKSVTTNMLGLLFINIGNEEPGKVVTIGNFNEINWSDQPFYLQVELDPNNALSFLIAGIEKINYVPLALYAEKSNMVESIVPVELGGTGVGTVKEIIKLLNLDKVNNTTDSLKPISNAMNIALNEKLKKSDTVYLSNRINAIPKVDTLVINNKLNQKLNFSDTIKLSNRINQKLNITDTLSLVNRILLATKTDTISLSNRINNKINIGAISNSDITGGLGYTPVKNNFGIFYDTSKQLTNIATATAIKFSFQPIASKIITALNTSGNPTRIMVVEAGIYQVNYMLQFIKAEAGTDEASIWIRKNSSAYPNTHTSYTIQGAGLKNIFTGNYFIELGTNDYIELFYSIKNSSTTLYGTAPITTTPSRPATPSAYLSIHSVN
ncbi:MAG: hypothetical protein RIR64_1322 [Bacteroidota bacterium]